jgi:hypothetical protein
MSLSPEVRITWSRRLIAGPEIGVPYWVRVCRGRVPVRCGCGESTLLCQTQLTEEMLEDAHPRVAEILPRETECDIRRTLERAIGSMCSSCGHNIRRRLSPEPTPRANGV